MSARMLDGQDLGAAFAAAQVDLLAAPAGTAATWALPPGEFALAGPLRFGAPDRSLKIEAAGTRLAIDLGPVRDGTPALLVEGIDVTLTGVTVAVTAQRQAVALSLRGSGVATGLQLAVDGAVGAGLVGLAAEAPIVRLRDAAVADLRSLSGVTTGIRVRAGTEADLLDLQARLLRGETVTGIRVEAPAGSLSDAQVEDIAARVGQAVGLRVSAGVQTERVQVIRPLTSSDAISIASVDLRAMLEAAQAGLAALPTGSAETWVLPGGTHALTAGLPRLGVEGVSLTVRGAAAPEAATVLTFEDGGPIAGDLLAMEVIGTDVSVASLAIRARANGELTTLRLQADRRVSAHDLRFDTLRGAAATGLLVDAPAATVEVVGVDAQDVDAVGGAAVGIDVLGQHVVLSRLAAADIDATDSARGIAATALSSLAATSVRADRIEGATAEGLRLRAIGATAELSALDLRAQQVTTPAGGSDAIGAVLLSGGDIEMRGCSAEGITGGRAIGMLAVPAGELDWLAGDVREIRATADGAAGARILAIPSPRRVSVQDVQFEAIRAATVGTEARPPVSWTDWIADPTVADALAEGTEVPALPAAGMANHAEDTVGLHIAATVTDDAVFLDTKPEPGAVFAAQCILRRISGTAVQIEGGLRDCELRGSEAWTSVRGGWIDGERVLLAQLTWHRHHGGFAVGPSELTVANSLFTGVGTGTALELQPGAELALAAAAYVAGGSIPLQPAPEPLPYVQPGPVSVPPSVLTGALALVAGVDLRLQPDDPLHDTAERVPGDPADTPLFVGAHPPDRDARCSFRDPLPPPAVDMPSPLEPSPVVDYRARDARSLLAVMMDRARTVLPTWTERGPADMTTMMMEVLASRLDHTAYRQEAAVAEGYIGTALARRSVEDHARLVDYAADPGLSATAMVRFDIDTEGQDALGLTPRFQAGGRLVIPADMLVGNPDAFDVSLIFATEDPLAFDPDLAELALEEDIAAGATSMVLAGDTPEIEIGRWLVIVPDDPEAPGQPDPDGLRHVVRVTLVELGTDTTRIFWDPRRPARQRYDQTSTRVLGNVVPAHHGVPLTPVSASGAAPDDPLGPWRELMRLTVDNALGDVQEVALPLSPISVQSCGWPLPDEGARPGRPQVAVSVDGSPWTQVDDLSLAGPSDRVFALRPGHQGGASVRFGDGDNGAALPRRSVTVELSLRIGLGRLGNVGTDALTRLVAFGAGGDIGEILPDQTDRDDLIRRHLTIGNPLPALGGRDAETLDHIRYTAPKSVRDRLSAVAVADYERLLTDLPEVAAARATVVDAGIRRVVRVTLLLKDEDTLGGEAADPLAEAERLRRWAAARHHLETIRLMGFDVELLPPVFTPLDLDLIVDAEPWVQSETVRVRVGQALGGDGGLFDPDRSGLGGDVHVDAIHRAVLGVDGVAAVRVRRMRRLVPHAVDFAEAGTLPIAGDEVAVLKRPYGPGEDGLATVTVCGGLP